MYSVGGGEMQATIGAINSAVVVAFPRIQAIST